MEAAKLSFLLLLLTFATVANSKTIIYSHFDLMGFTGDGERGTGGLLKTCDGAVGECIDEDEETMIDSSTDMIRRALKGRGKFISYGAMRRNQVPCNRRGTSYYSCGRASKVNPYNRGCSKITNCYRYLG